MTGLAVGWEADYDGSRWFYRYKSTGLTQYTFPKAGDEFPEHVGTGHEAFGLAPEERLASNRQVRKRTSPSSSPTRGSHGAAAVVGGMSATTGYFDPLAWHDDFDVSPDTPGGGDLKGQGTVSEPASTVPSLAATPASAPPATLASGSTDIVVDGVVVGGEGDSVSAAIEEAIVHMLDGRPIAREAPGMDRTLTTSTQSSPIGNVAELPTADTVKCADELAPVEMDGASSSPGFSGTHVNPYAPAELSNEGVSIQAKKSEFSNSDPTATSSRQEVTRTEKIATAGDIQNAGIKAWKPAGRLSQDSSGEARPFSMNPPRPSTFRSWNSELAITDPKRHSISGTLPSSGSVERHPTVLTPAKVPKTTANLKADAAPKGLLRSPIPSILRPARGVVPKQDVQIPGTNARHDSISTEIQATKDTASDAGMAHFPSVLKPAGRQKGASNTAALALRPAQPEDRPRADSLQGQQDIPSSSSEKIYQRRPVSMLMEHRSVSAAELEGLSSVHSSGSRPATLRHVSDYPHGGMAPPRPSTTAPDQARRESGHSTIVHELGTGNESQVPSGQLPELSSVGQISKGPQAISTARAARPAQTTPYPPSEAPSQASSPAVPTLSAHQPSNPAHSQPAVGMGDIKGSTNMTVEQIYPVAASFSSRDVEAATMVSERRWPKPAVDYSGDSWGDEW